MTERPAPPRVLETALYATDLDAAEAFYAGVLGFERITRLANRHIFFRLTGSILLIFNPEETVIPSRNADLPVPPHGARGPGHACFAAPGDTLDHWRAHFDAAHIDIEAEMLWPSGARSIYLRDPAGNSLEFAEPQLWGL